MMASQIVGSVVREDGGWRYTVHLAENLDVTGRTRNLDRAVNAAVGLAGWRR